jgi:WD40 repeat protein
VSSRLILHPLHLTLFSLTPSLRPLCPLPCPLPSAPSPVPSPLPVSPSPLYPSPLSLSRSHDGKMVATGGSMGVLRLFRLQLSPVALHRSTEVRGHSKPITSLAFSLDDKQIVSVGEDGGIFVWSVYA